MTKVNWGHYPEYVDYADLENQVDRIYLDIEFFKIRVEWMLRDSKRVPTSVFGMSNFFGSKMERKDRKLMREVRKTLGGEVLMEVISDAFMASERYAGKPEWLSEWTAC